MARHLKTSPGKIYRIVKAFNEGGLEAVQKLRWGKGTHRRKSSLEGITTQQMSLITHKGTLYQQAGLSMAARAIQFSNLIGREVKPP